jgi:catechol 2,3-dioxygenase-like lactoylglutathione lyase family enzyme
MGAAILNHTGLCVSDLERSRRFYTEVFGFRPWFEISPSDESSAALLDLEPPMGLTATYLELGGFILELISYSARSVRPSTHLMDDLGLTHLSLAVDDIPGTVAKAIELGGAAVVDIGMAFMITDPDGQKLELLPMGYRKHLPPLPT